MENPSTWTPTQKLISQSNTGENAPEAIAQALFDKGFLTVSPEVAIPTIRTAFETVELHRVERRCGLSSTSIIYRALLDAGYLKDAS